MRTTRPERETTLEGVNKVCVGARIEPELAQAARRLAKPGSRIRSREVTRRFVGSSLLERFSTGGHGSIRRETTRRDPRAIRFFSA
jgi:hypothetical protein